MARRTFRRIFAAENRQTGDGRILSPGSMRWETDPMVLRWMPKELGWGHQGAVPVGTIESWERDGDGNLWASGFVDDEIPAAAEMLQLIDAGVPIGVSVDMDDVTVEIVDTSVTIEDVMPPGPVDMEHTGRRLGLVHYDSVSLMLGSSVLRRHARPGNLQAAANDPDPGGEVWWSFSMDEVLERFVDGRIRGATGCDLPAFDFARMGFDGASTSEDAGSETADEVEPEPVAASAAQAWAAGRRHLAAIPTEVPVSAEIADRIRTVTTVTAAGVPVAPPAAWFEVPEPDERTPLTVTDDGRVFGHMWAWGDCHTGSPAGNCVLAPRSSQGLPWFHTGYLVTAEGTRLPVGALTVGGGHADENGTAAAAREHYDNVATVWADIRVVEGRVGGWACGAARPGLTPELLRAVRAAAPSGDWRGVGGRSELIGIHQVVHPGFPVVRVGRDGEPLAIVAAGVWQPDRQPEAQRMYEAGTMAAAEFLRQLGALRADVTAEPRARLRAAGTARARERLRR